jgi:hypothetical protein
MSVGLESKGEGKGSLGTECGSGELDPLARWSLVSNRAVCERILLSGQDNCC